MTERFKAVLINRRYTLWDIDLQLIAERTRTWLCLNSEEEPKRSGKEDHNATFQTHSSSPNEYWGTTRLG